ncbi:type IV pilus assembly protein PilP [Halomonas fontilapidosi]|uniref:Type IV pilus assembly protein PilP n=1 Tax=Halomonas fontilapidosi TaxID=616675 RepID=A0A7W5DIZ2_9GAMM|nr:pilus assembly protein PilP [Halomonas fontilapidosi]MBB3183802.1 type IV pilus assembly protein PilP [Halomonas fontilapidosi]
MKHWLTRVALLALLLALGACRDANLPALERELEAMRVDPGEVDLEPVPPMPTYTSVDYQFADERSPFQARPPEPEELPGMGADSNVAPDESRPKDPLEAYDLSQLELVGTLTVGGQPSALVQSPEGQVHRLRTGDHMGSDFGRIIGITESSVQLVEIVPTGRGGWTERSTRLTLKD